ERAQSERGEAVPELLLHGGGAAIDHRRRRPALGASANQGKARPQGVQGYQDLQGRRRRRRKAGRGDQGTLQQVVRRVRTIRMATWFERPRFATPLTVMPITEESIMPRYRNPARRDVLKGSSAAIALS